MPELALLAIYIPRSSYKNVVSGLQQPGKNHIFPPSFGKQRSTACFCHFDLSVNGRKISEEGGFGFFVKLSFSHPPIKKLSTRAYIPNSDQGKQTFNLCRPIFSDGSKLTVDIFLVIIMISITIF